MHFTHTFQEAGIRLNFKIGASPATGRTIAIIRSIFLRFNKSGSGALQIAEHTLGREKRHYFLPKFSQFLFWFRI